MPVTALVSVKSSGVTASSLALTLASKRPSLLAECDPAGGTIRAGLLAGQADASYGLYHLARAERTGLEALANAFASHLWPLDPGGHRKLLPGLTDPAQAAAMARTWDALADVLHIMAEQAGYDVFVDGGRLALEAGRLHPTLTPAALLYRADMVLLVVRGTEQSLTLARHVLPTLRAELQEHGSGADALALLLIEDGDFRAHRVAEVLGAPVLAALPHDPDPAHYLTAGGRQPRGYGRSPLLLHARTATEQIGAAAARRRIHQHYPRPAASDQVAGILQRLNLQHPQPGVNDG
ncbi:hypothetical protein BIV25_37300 [Streptomyces sp. MUSC 14]|nr:hypothetical protein [Streptomyces sp. MUSC 14]OIJ88164.1 hypothetical protein BIV25_37300 [Streptomyces sp. MUSC 14]